MQMKCLSVKLRNSFQGTHLSEGNCGHAWSEMHEISNDGLNTTCYLWSRSANILAASCRPPSLGIVGTLSFLGFDFFATWDPLLELLWIRCDIGDTSLWVNSRKGRDSGDGEGGTW